LLLGPALEVESIPENDPGRDAAALTTVRQPLAEMGRTAVSLLSRFLDGQSFERLTLSS
jgi:DNA-binding LacI/PurR family transcriptional regulator